MRKLLFLFVLLLLVSPLFARGGQAASAGAARPKVSYYQTLGRAGQGHATLATHPIWIEIQKRLNIDVEFRSPPMGNEVETFNLMIASRDFPDIINYPWLNAPGGAGQYIADGVIIPLNEPIDKWAPAFKQSWATYPVAKRESTMDDGTLYLFPVTYSNDTLAHWWGPLARKDLLPEVVGFDASRFPDNVETLEEWERLLVAVKNSGLKGDGGRDIIPLSFVMDGTYHSAAFIVGAWNISTRFTQENGKPVYGPSDPRYREYVTFMKRWYDMGLIDSEYAGNTEDILDQKVLDNRVFALAGAMGAASTRYTALARPTNPAFTLATLKYPVLRKGDAPNLAFKTFYFTGSGSAISTACKDVETAVRLLDYPYSDEGYVLTNFGIEGDTFNWEPGNYTTTLPNSTRSGYPRYADIMLNNPNGYSRDVAIGIYLLVGGPVGIKSPEFIEQRDHLPEQNGPNGRALWMAATNRNKIPAVIPTQEESAEFARIMNGINTYVDEMTIKFITGVEPINDAKWNEFIQTQQRMGVAQAAGIMSAQIERYNKRP